MSVQAIIGMVRSLSGILEKTNAQGEIHLVKSGALLHPGDVLTLLSGEAYIQFVTGFPEALALYKPLHLDGVSPALKNSLININEEIIQEAVAKGIDPALILDSLAATAAGGGVLGSGGEAFFLNPMYSSGLVTAGFETAPIIVSYDSNYQQQVIFYDSKEADATTFQQTVDNSNPTLTIIQPPTVTLDMDSGFSISDRITNNGQITVGSLVAGATWQYSLDGGTSWLPGSGTSFVLPPNIIYGDDQIQVRQVDSQGHFSVPTTLSRVEIDTTAPTVSVNSEVTNDTTPALTGTVDDPTATVNVTVNGHDYTATNNGDGTWTLADNTVTALVQNSYPITVTATDLAGNAGHGAGTLVIDTTAPTVSVNSEVTNDTTPALTGTVDDPTATVTVSVNGHDYTATNNGDGTWTLADNTVTALVQNSYPITVNATDAAGNVGSGSGNLIVTIPIADNTTSTGSEDPITAISVTLSGTDAVGSISSFTIGTLPTNGTLYTDAALTHAVTAGQVITATNNSATLYFSPTSNWSGNTIVQYTATDSFNQTSTTGTATIAVAAVADTPTLNIGAAAAPDTGLTKYYWAGHELSTLTTNGNGANPSDLQAAVDNAFANPNLFPTTSVETITNVNNAGASNVVQGTASLQTGLIYLVAGTSYNFSGMGDDSIRIIVGNNVVASATWGGSSGKFSGTFVPTVTGYYNLNIYHNNSNGPGNYNVKLNGQDLNTTNYELYKTVTDITNAGITLSTFSDGMYAGFNLNQGNENTAISLSKVTANLVDTDGSESLSITVRNIPTGSVLSDGIHHFTATAGNQVADVSGWNLSTLTIVPPTNFVGTIPLQVMATSNEAANHDQALSTGTINVQVLPINSPTMTLAVDSGTSNTDNITNNGQINVGGVGAGNTWQYSTNGGATWINGTGTSFNLPEGSYASGKVEVRQIDSAGATSTPSVYGAITVDNTIATPTLNLAADTGLSNADGITNNGQVNVIGLETGSTWQYTTNGGTTWTNGTGSNFNLAAGAYGAGQVEVRQTDVAGNVSSLGVLGAVTIDKSVATPGLTLAADTGSSSTDGITTNGHVNVANLEAGSTWQYTTNGGSTWQTGVGTSFNLAAGNYAAGQIEARQTDVAGNVSSLGILPTVTVDQSAPVATVTSSSSVFNNGVANTITFTFTEPVSNLTTSNITTAGGVLSGLTQSSSNPNVWTASFTANGSAPVSIGVTGYADTAGNSGTSNTYTAAAPPVANADTVNAMVQTGMVGQFYNYNSGSASVTAGANSGTALTSVTQVQNYLNQSVAPTPNATFTSSVINYVNIGSNLGGYTSTTDNLKNWLGNDASSLVRAGTALNTNQAIIHMQGLVQLAAGTYNFKVTADDGFSILVDGVDVATYNANQSPTSRVFSNFTISNSGLHTVEIFYYDQGGQYVFQPQLQSVVNGVGQGYNYLGVSDVNGNGALVQNDIISIDVATLLSNDTDANASHALNMVNVSSNVGTATLDGNGHIVLSNLPAAYTGAVTISYQLQDTAHSNVLSNVSSVTVNVAAPVLAAPTFLAGMAFENLGGSLNTSGVISATNIESALGFNNGTLSSFNPAGSQAGTVTAVNGNYASNTYYLNSGSTISLKYTFNNAENATQVANGNNDMLLLVVKDSHGTIVQGPTLITSSEQINGASSASGTYVFTAPAGGQGAYEFDWIVVNGNTSGIVASGAGNSSVTLTTAGAANPEVAVVDLPISASIANDISGMDAFKVVIAGVPTGAYLSAGTAVANGNTTTWTLTEAQLHDLQFISGAAGTYSLTVSSMATDTNGNTSIVSHGMTVDINVISSSNTYQGTVNNDSMSHSSDTANYYYSGGDGNDTIFAGSGDNLIFGGAGNDSITGSSSANAQHSVIHGGDGNDTVSVTNGNNTIYGDAGNDIISGGSGIDLLHGGIGNDTILGGAGNDTLIGGQGDDKLTGGGGIDTFVWMQGDNTGGTLSGTAVDTITDFKANPVATSANASILNLSDLLSGEHLHANSLDNYLNVSATNGDTTIKIDPTGHGSFGAPTQTIVLTGVDLTAVFATNNSHAIIDHLITNGNLITNH